MDRGVGIGVQVPTSKLHVFHNTFTGGLLRTAISGGIAPNDLTNTFTGVTGTAAPTSTTAFLGLYNQGVFGEAKNGRENIGVLGKADFTTTAGGSGSVIGVLGSVAYNSTQPPGLLAGVYGITNAPSNLTSWAGYFNGNVNVIGQATT